MNKKKIELYNLSIEVPEDTYKFCKENCFKYAAVDADFQVYFYQEHPLVALDEGFWEPQSDTLFVYIVDMPESKLDWADSVINIQEFFNE